MKRFTPPRALNTGLVVAGFAILALFGSAQAVHAQDYQIQSGDRLSTIRPSDWQAVCDHNIKAGLIADCDWIYVGNILDIPEYTHVETVAAPAPTSAAPTQATTQVRGNGGPNGYVPGWCTWYVKTRRPDIGGYWGDAGSNWLTAARNAGFSTGYTPAPGAIGVTAGHVVYVESVNGNGSVNISEMGWMYTQWNKNYRTVPASSFVYIY